MPKPVTRGSVGTTSRLASGETSEVLSKTTSATGRRAHAGRDRHGHVRADGGRQAPQQPLKGAEKSEHPDEGGERQLEAHVEHGERVQRKDHARGKAKDLPLVPAPSHPATRQERRRS